MKNLKVTINRSAGVKSMKYCLGRKKICADVAFALKTQIRSSWLRKVLRSDTIILYLPRPGRQFTERYRLQWIAIFLF